MNRVVVGPRSMNWNAVVIAESEVASIGTLAAARTSWGRYSPVFMTPRPRKNSPAISRASASRVARFVPSTSRSTTV